MKRIVHERPDESLICVEDYLRNTTVAFVGIAVENGTPFAFLTGAAPNSKLYSVVYLNDLKICQRCPMTLREIFKFWEEYNIYCFDTSKELFKWLHDGWN